jgi:hypothetical protein
LTRDCLDTCLSGQCRVAARLTEAGGGGHEDANKVNPRGQLIIYERIIPLFVAYGRDRIPPEVDTVMASARVVRQWQEGAISWSIVVGITYSCKAIRFYDRWERGDTSRLCHRRVTTGQQKRQA